MAGTPRRIAFLGTPEVAVPVLQALAEVHPLASVFANPDRPAGRGRVLSPPPVKVLAESLGLPVHQPPSWKTPEIRTLWESLGIDLGVVVAYGHLLPAWMLEACPLGVWNLHFSLLPRWRGAAPVNHAILAGDAETGVSLMRLIPGLDAGPVLAQSRRPILDGDTTEGLLMGLAGEAADLLRAHLPDLLEGRGEALPQDEAQVTLAPKLRKEMARMDPRRPARELHRQVRGLHPWPGTELDLEGEVLKVVEVGRLAPAPASPGTLVWDRSGAWLACGDGEALELLRLQRSGRPVQPALQALQPWGPSGARTILG